MRCCIWLSQVNKPVEPIALVLGTPWAIGTLRGAR